LMSADMHVECAIASFVGDADEMAPVAFRVRDDSRTVVVADSIGHRGPAVGAAHRATNALLAALPPFREPSLDPTQALCRALDAANAAVSVPDIESGSGLPGTVSMAVIMVRGPDVVIAGIGNIRCYRTRAGGVSLVTRERSSTTGLRSAEGKPAHALGIGSSIQPEVTVQCAREGDRYVLCSAAVWTLARAEDFVDSVARARNAGDACQALRTRARSSNRGFVIAVMELSAGTHGRISL